VRQNVLKGRRKGRRKEIMRNIKRSKEEVDQLWLSARAIAIAKTIAIAIEQQDWKENIYTEKRE
jgi:hypothetical protein